MPKRSELPAAKRVEAVLAMLRKEDTAVQVARRYEISEQTLYRWKDEFVAGGSARIEGKNGDQTAAKEVGRLQREIETREQVIGELTMANRILKKLSGPSV
jgi:transposase